MGTYPPPPPGYGRGSRFEETIERIEAELRNAVAYVNDAVVPQVRRESISAMRTLSDTLRNLADRIERNRGATDSAAASSTGSSTSGPASSGPASSGPVSSGPVSSGPVSSGPVSSGPVSTSPKDPQT